MSQAAWWKRWAGPTVVGGLALGLFLKTLAPTVTAEDSGELIAGAWHFGIVHPPGYPLWTLLCGLFVHLVPIDPIAFRANLFSAVCSAGAAVAAYAALREVGLSKPAAGAAALVWVWSRWSWSQSVIAEVYPLNSLLTATVLWCALRWYRTRSEKPLVAASLLMGLGMSNHPTIALAGLPLVVWILVQRPGLVLRGRLVLRCLAMFGVGLLPYLYLPVRAVAQPPMNWGDPSTFQRFLEHVTRRQYSAFGPIKVAEPRSLKRFGPQLRYLGEALLDDLTPALTIASSLGLIVLTWRDRRLLFFVLLWLMCAGPMFAWMANYDLDRTSRWAMRVFLIPAPLGAAVGLAFLLDGLGSLLRRILVRQPRMAGAMVLLLAGVGPAVQAVSHWSPCNYSRYWYAEDHARNLLHCMLPNALVFPSGDHNGFPLTYLVLVEGERPDVMIGDIYGYVRPELCRDRPADSPEAPEPWLIRRARRPVYYTTKKAPPVENAEFVSAGLLYHLLPEGMAFDNTGLLEKCSYRNIEQPTEVDFGASHIMVDYAFFSGLRDLERTQPPEAPDRAEEIPANGSGGDSVRSHIQQALAHFRRAVEFGNGIKEVYNNIGSALGEHGLEHEAVDYFREAARLDRRYVMPRWNLFRLLKNQARWWEARQVLEELIEAAPDDYRPYGEMGFLLRDRLDNPQEAVFYWQESLRRNPSQPAIVQALNQPHFRSGSSFRGP